MATINYEDVTPYLLSKVEEYDFLKFSIEELNDSITQWLHSTISKPYVRKLFSSISLDDESNVLTYEMSYSIDEETDREFILEILGLGLGIQWITPIVNSSLNVRQVYASKEEKYYSQAQHLSELRSLRKDWIKEQRDMIRDRGYIWNSYLDGDQT